MTDYRRFRAAGASWFFTLSLAERYRNGLLVAHVDLLRRSFVAVGRSRPYAMDAVVVLPEHLHCIWTLPDADTDFSTRWRLIKAHFSRGIGRDEWISSSRLKRRERGIWQRRFWARLLLDEADFNAHVDYIHWNPVRHGHVRVAIDWPYSSFRRFVGRGFYPEDWGGPGNQNIEAGE